MFKSLNVELKKFGHFIAFVVQLKAEIESFVQLWDFGKKMINVTNQGKKRA